MITIKVNANDLSSALLDMYDIRNALSSKIKAMPKDNDGTETSIGDCINAVIDMLEQCNSPWNDTEITND